MLNKEHTEFLGRTLGEIAKTTGHRAGGYAVFLLTHDDDPLGDLVGEGYTVQHIVNGFPELANHIVKYTNDYMGEIVLRIAKPAEGRA